MEPAIVKITNGKFQIPDEFLSELGWKPGQHLIMKYSDNQIKIIG